MSQSKVSYQLPTARLASSTAVRRVLEDQEADRVDQLAMVKTATADMSPEQAVGLIAQVPAWSELLGEYRRLHGVFEGML